MHCFNIQVLSTHPKWALGGKHQYLGCKDDADQGLACLTELVGRQWIHRHVHMAPMGPSFKWVA